MACHKIILTYCNKGKIMLHSEATKSFNTLFKPQANNSQPVSYISNHAVDMLDCVSNNRQPIFITKDNQPQAVVLDMQSYQEIAESFALLKVLGQSQEDINQGKIKPAKQALADIRAKFG